MFEMEERGAGGGLFAWANGSRQTAVVDAIGVVPKRLAQFNAFAENFNFLGATCWGVGRGEAIVFVGDKVFIVAVSQDGLKNVLALTHLVSLFRAIEALVEMIRQTPSYLTDVFLSCTEPSTRPSFTSRVDY